MYDIGSNMNKCNWNSCITKQPSRCSRDIQAICQPLLSTTLPICKACIISLSHMASESYDTKGMESYHGHRSIPYHGHGIIPWTWKHTIPREWNHTMDMESYHTKGMESYHGHGITPYQGNGIIPRAWNHTIPRDWNHTMKMESYQNRMIPCKDRKSQVLLNNNSIKFIFKIKGMVDSWHGGLNKER